MSAMVEARVQALLQAPSSPPRRVPMLPTSGGAQLNVDWEPQKKRFALSLQSKRSHRAQLSATELHAAHRDLRKAQPSLDELFPAKLAPRTCSEAQPVCAELKRYLKAVLEGECTNTKYDYFEVDRSFILKFSSVHSELIFIG